MKNPIAEAYLEMLHEKKKQEDKMDPVGKADADIDNDGDVDDSDEYLHKRRKAIKKSMKKEEKTECPKCDAKGCDHCDNTGYHTEAVEIETDDDKTDVEDPKAAKKKGPEKKKKEDPAATNAPSQDDREAAADDGEEKIVVKKKDKKDDKEANEALERDGRNRGTADLKPSQIQKLDKTGKNKTMRRYVTKKLGVAAKQNKKNDPGGEKKGLGPAALDKSKADNKAKKRFSRESFDWDAIVEMNDVQVDQFIDGLNDEQLDLFEAEMKSKANPEGEADEYNKDQKKFKDMHVKNIIDRPDADKPAAADATKPAAKRPGDNDAGDKKPVKTLKDLRK